SFLDRFDNNGLLTLLLGKLQNVSREPGFSPDYYEVIGLNIAYSVFKNLPWLKVGMCQQAIEQLLVAALRCPQNSAQDLMQDIVKSFAEDAPKLNEKDFLRRCIVYVLGEESGRF